MRIRISLWRKDQLERVLAGENQWGSPWQTVHLNPDAVMYDRIDGELLQLVLVRDEMYVHPDDVEVYEKAIEVHEPVGLAELVREWWHGLFK